MVMPNRPMLLDWHMYAIQLIYVMERLWVADSDDGWVTWVGVWGVAGNSTWIGGTGGDDRGVDGDDDGDGENDVIGGWYDVGTQRWTMTIYYITGGY